MALVQSIVLKLVALSVLSDTGTGYTHALSTTLIVSFATKMPVVGIWILLIATSESKVVMLHRVFFFGLFNNWASLERLLVFTKATVLNFKRVVFAR